MNLSVTLGRMTLKNPVVLASGTCGYGREIAPYLDLNTLGAITVKGLSLFPWEGNPPPRLFEVRAGLLNSIGLENKGVERFLQEDLPFLEALDTRVFVNIWGKTVEEYVAVARKLDAIERIDALELNVSCPNVEKGGASFLLDPEALRELVGRVREATGKFLIVKLGPKLQDWEVTVRILEEEGAEALSVTNSFPAMVVDVERMDFVFAMKSAGLSGPAIKPLALKMVYDLVGMTELPIIGMGGIMTAEDALEFLLVGARAVGVGTANLVAPSSAADILEGIKAYLLRKDMENIEDLIGRVR
jgi:dihydroorotate dehydrogenase (NAD+) catalytic subunit|uniref:Dihydroorotate dehydrogenase n=1 Tax=Candidatus Caldatribacterium californiense TaxID=1454726 RepID=A0A7V3YG94_9BACT